MKSLAKSNNKTKTEAPGLSFVVQSYIFYNKKTTVITIGAVFNKSTILFVLN